MKKYLVNPVILSDEKVANTGCPITMLILQNKPNFPHFSPKIEDLSKKQTQTNPIQTQSNPIFTHRSTAEDGQTKTFKISVNSCSFVVRNMQNEPNFIRRGGFQVML
jgi:hypothetical protein